MVDKSNLQIGTPIKKNRLYPNGWKIIGSIPPDEVCCVVLGGVQTVKNQAAHGYAKMIKEILPSQCNIYSATYDFADLTYSKDYEIICNRYNHYYSPKSAKHNEHTFKEDPDYPQQYLKDAYQKTLAPRLRDENGNRVSVEKLATRLNKISFVNHCIGSTISFEMEKLLNNDLNEMGYPNKFHDYLLKQVHCSDIAPIIPYGASKFTRYKFVSCSDEIAMSIAHPKIEYVKERKKEENDIPFKMNINVMRPTSNETVFVVNSIYNKEVYSDPNFKDVEHTLNNYTDKDDYIIKGYETYEREISGDFLSMLTRETINWIASNSLKNETELHELPSIFTEKRFSRLINFAQENHYKMMKNEINYLHLKKQNSH